MAINWIRPIQHQIICLTHTKTEKQKWLDLITKITESVVMSKRLERRRRRLRLFRRRKYFWAWLATWVGVRVLTYFLEIPLQSPFPTFCNPMRNSLCSSSVHGTPKRNTQSNTTWIKINTAKLIKSHRWGNKFDLTSLTNISLKLFLKLHSTVSIKI